MKNRSRLSFSCTLLFPRRLSPHTHTHTHALDSLVSYTPVVLLLLLMFSSRLSIRKRWNDWTSRDGQSSVSSRATSSRLLASKSKSFIIKIRKKKDEVSFFHLFFGWNLVISISFLACSTSFIHTRAST